MGRVCLREVEKYKMPYRVGCGSDQCLAKFFLTSHDLICIKTVSKKFDLKVPGSHLIKIKGCFATSYHLFPSASSLKPFSASLGLKNHRIISTKCQKTLTEKVKL